MNERINALRGKLPDGVPNQIAMYDSHPTADLMRGVKIKAWDEYGPIASGMQVIVSKSRCTSHTRIRGTPSQIAEH